MTGKRILAAVGAMIALTACGDSPRDSLVEPEVPGPSFAITQSDGFDLVAGHTAQYHFVCDPAGDTLQSPASIQAGNTICASNTITTDGSDQYNVVIRFRLLNSNIVIPGDSSSFVGTGTWSLAGEYTPPTQYSGYWGTWRVYMCSKEGSGYPGIGSSVYGLVVCGDGNQVDSATFTVTAPPVTHTLTLIPTAQRGGGEVVSDPSGLDCRTGYSCKASFADSTVVTVTAIPDIGSRIASWAHCTVVQGSDHKQCSVTLTMDTTVTVGFDTLYEAMLVKKDTIAGLTGTVTSTSGKIDCGTNCYNAYYWGSTDTLTAIPEPGLIFTGWATWSENPCPGDSTCVVTLDRSTDLGLTDTVTAHFALADTLKVAKDGSGSGTVTGSPGGIDCGAICMALLADGQVDTLVATPDAGSEFGGWAGACSGSDPTCIVTLNGTKSVTATFVKVDTLTVALDGSGVGTVTSKPAGIDCGVDCSAAFPEGQADTLIAKSDAGSEFTGWSGACSGADTTCVVTLSDNASVAATFSHSVDTLTVATDGSGTGKVTSDPAGIDCGSTCTATYPKGNSVTLTATPEGGSVFSGWGGACTGSSGTCVVDLAGSDTVTATFTKSYMLTVTKSGAGDGTVESDPPGIDCGTACSAAYPEGKSVTLTATASAGSTFNGWSGDCSGTGDCTVTMDSNRTVDALFKANQTLNWSVAPPASAQFGATFIVAATSSASLTPTYSVLGSCSISGATVTIEGYSGTCTVYADQAGNGDYNAASQINGVVTISPRPTTLTVSVSPASVQYSDLVDLTATVSPCSVSGETATGTVTFSVNSVQVGSAQPIDASCAASIAGHQIGLQPGDYSVSATFTSTDPHFEDSSGSTPLTVTSEDAKAYYTGVNFASTPSAYTSSFTVPLSATIRDITAEPGSLATDPNAGDIRNAVVSLTVNGSDVAGCSDLTPQLIDPSNLTTGTVACSWSGDLGNSDDETYEVNVVVSGYYSFTTADQPVVVAKPVRNSIAGGGFIVNAASAGQFAAADGLDTHFGFNVHFNKSRRKLQGNVNIILDTPDGHEYQIRSNALRSLSTNPNTGTAEFLGKANLTDITDPENPVSIGGNLTLQLSAVDGSPDQVAFTLLDSSGKVLYASNWGGASTTQSTLAGGNIQVK